MMTDSNQAHIGIVGYGIRGRLFAGAIQQHPAASLVAISDPSSQARNAAEEEFRLPTYASADEMVNSHPELTAAIIATPDFAHKDAAVACAGRGLDVLIEKPLATTTEDAEDIIAAAAHTEARIMVGFENRWNPRFTMVRDILQAGDSGTILNQVINLNDTLYVPTEMLSWAAQSSPAWFLMPHTLDLAMWLSSTHPVSVRATGVKKLLNSMGVDTWDCISATFEMNNGSYVVLNSSWILPRTAPAVYDFRHEIQTTKVTIHIEGANQGVTHYGLQKFSWPQGGGREKELDVLVVS